MLAPSRDYDVTAPFWRANPAVTGYHYWLIVDFPGGAGEGDSWEEGWVDYFWQPKVKPEQLSLIHI